MNPYPFLVCDCGTPTTRLAHRPKWRTAFTVVTCLKCRPQDRRHRGEDDAKWAARLFNGPPTPSRAHLNGLGL